MKEITLLPGESVMITATKPDVPVPPDPSPSPDSLGIPFGPFALDLNNPKPFTFGTVPSSPGSVVGQIKKARQARVSLALALCGGSHDKYLTNGKFDKQKWFACMDEYNRSDIKAEIAQGVEDRTVLFNLEIDEANHKTWGGVFTENPAIIDELSRYSKKICPTLPTGLVIQLGWHDDYVYTDTDYLIHQFSYDLKDVGAGVDALDSSDPVKYRDRALALAKIHKTKPVFSLNWINGGPRVAGCPTPQTGGLGQEAPNCRMTEKQIEQAVDKLTAKGAAGMLMWQRNDHFPFTEAYLTAFARSVALLKTRIRL